MSDFDTRRIGEIHALEERINSMHKELAIKKAAADKWEPKVGVSMDSTTESAKVTMHFGGKAFSAEVPLSALQTGTVVSITTAVIETLCAHLVAKRLKEVVEPEVRKLLASVAQSGIAGKW